MKRYMDYKVFLQCQSGIPVVTVIICTHHVKSEVYIYNETETSLLKPLIRYLFDYDDEVNYLSFRNKIKTNSKFNHHEVQFLVFSPFMTSRRFRQDKVRDVCALIEEIKEKELFDDTELYLPLILAIKQYVSDEEEQKKLMEVLTMDMSADEIYEKVMNSGIYEQGIDVGLKRGIEQGMEKGKFDMAIETKINWVLMRLFVSAVFLEENLKMNRWMDKLSNVAAGVNFFSVFPVFLPIPLKL